MYQDLSSNLKLLCSYYDSIAQVCRELDINRSQFNRYLTGRYKPSASTLRKLCDFFGVEEYELMLPAPQFARLIQVRPRPSAEPVASRIENEHLALLHKASGTQMDKYLGFYFEYYLSMAVPGKILRNLICIEKQNDGVFYQRTERLRESATDPAYHSKYLGVVVFLTDRIFMADYESLATNEVTETILIPSYKNRINRLNGLRLGVPANGVRTPSCTRVVMEYLGAQVDVRKALGLCGLYHLDDKAIDDSIREAVKNDMQPGEWHFRARSS
ncbi:helix-turn-helix transcriptional regulator [Neptunomonas phycophila]|jgi:transcriptional regulator with XRE-family HTH domain|uniref:helix-turn-helix domain-containing protein n=1 Tax=Neptunomonas TaxID=75687 RepID=UPI0015C0C94A|nr:helix-turn-helix transcriptional regulator [Neptunomonas phycophila]QLE98729.1 helix-turn-helix transcriptional regulator [Neptunomonas phycophila]